MEVNISQEEWFLLIDKIAYERIINNLLSNALKHGKCSMIIIKIYKHGSTIIIEVTNEGIMIPKEEINYIFERLYKCNSVYSQNGNGLGLAIVKELVTTMQGKITVQSFKGKTSFYISFPIYLRKK